MAKIYKHKDELDFTIGKLPDMLLPQHIFMVEPKFFSVDYVINPHMEGNVGTVDSKKAWQEWDSVRKAYERMGLQVHTLNGQPGYPDMVFCANQSFPFLTEDNEKHVLMSIMHSEQRKGEVPFIENWYREQGYSIRSLDSTQIHDFEGMGDAIWINGKRLILGGYGYRSSIDAYQTISQSFNIPVVALELTTESFYHLDTCFCSLNNKTALYYPTAFKPEGIDLLQKLFSDLIEVNQYEAEELFACNATCPDGKHIVIQKGCTSTNQALTLRGFEVIEVETEEFLKSGGSVFCMKMMAW